MIKKYLLNTVAAIVLSNVCTMPVVFSMEGRSSDSARRDFHNELLGVIPVSGTLTAAPRVLGGVMRSISYRPVFYTQEELVEKGYMAADGVRFPVFSDIGTYWSLLNYDDLKDIVDNPESSEVMRQAAFNRLGFAMENIKKKIYTSVVDWRGEGTDGETFSLFFKDDARSDEENKAIVSITRLFAKVTLWNSVMDPEVATCFNPLLSKILTHREVSGELIYYPYAHYLLKIDGIIEDALKVQRHLVEKYPTAEHAVSGMPTISHPKRIKGILYADQARVSELLLLNRKLRTGLDLTDLSRNDVVDADSKIRKKAYDFYRYALSQGASKTCLLGMMRLIDGNGYLPIDEAADKNSILLKLTDRYLAYPEDDGHVRQAIARRALGARTSQSQRIDGYLPKPGQQAKGYVEELKARLSGSFAEGAMESASADFVGVSVVSSSAGFDSTGADAGTEFSFAGAGTGFSDSSSSSDAAISVSGIESNSRMTVGSSRSLVIDTNVTESSSGARSGQLSSKSPHLSVAKQEEIKAYFSRIGGRDGAREMYGSLEKAYHQIAIKFGVTKSQAEYASVRQNEYQRKSAEKRKVSAKFNDESDNEWGKTGRLSSDDEVVVRGAKRGRHTVISDSEESDSDV
jgi:hypothetical protein